MPKRLGTTGLDYSICGTSVPTSHKTYLVKSTVFLSLLNRAKTNKLPSRARSDFFLLFFSLRKWALASFLGPVYSLFYLYQFLKGSIEGSELHTRNILQCFSTLLLEGNPISFTDVYLVYFTLILFNPLCNDIYVYKI